MIVVAALVSFVALVVAIAVLSDSAVQEAQAEQEAALSEGDSVEDALSFLEKSDLRFGVAAAQEDFARRSSSDV